MRSPIALAPLLAALASAPLTAQIPHQGNGVGSAFLASTPAVIGGQLDVALGSPAIPNGLVAFCAGDSFGPITLPMLGPVCLDPTTPEFFFEYLVLDGQGNATTSYAVPNLASLVGTTPLFAACVAFEPAAGISISKTMRVDYENPASFRTVGALGTGRALHTATALGGSPRDNETRVLIAGGGGGNVLVPLATDSTELYLPLTKTFAPGPTMAVERTLHQAVRLADGRVLISGGADSNGVVTTSCELFDPATDTLSPTGSLGSPRAGHAATLLANGLVLVTGDVADYVDPINNLLAVLNTAQNTAELYDPATGAWSPVAATMSETRSGHVHTPLPNGAVLVTGGIRGAVLSTLLMLPVPVYSGACDVYDPAANTFTQTGSMVTTRAFHGASVLSSGDVLVSGGTISNIFLGTVSTTDGCEVWDGSTWSMAPSLPQPLSNHVQVAADDGDALVFGGLTGAFPNLVPVDTSGRHDGAGYTAGPLLGENPGIPAAPITPRAAAAAVRLADGTWLIVGGTDGAVPLTSAMVFQQ